MTIVPIKVPTKRVVKKYEPMPVVLERETAMIVEKEHKDNIPKGGDNIKVSTKTEPSLEKGTVFAPRSGGSKQPVALANEGQGQSKIPIQSIDFEKLEGGVYGTNKEMEDLHNAQLQYSNHWLGRKAKYDALKGSEGSNEWKKGLTEREKKVKREAQVLNPKVGQWKRESDEERH